MNNYRQQQNINNNNNNYYDDRHDNGDQSYEYRPSDAYVKKEQELKKKLLTEEFQQADLNKD